jgi:hypothetical protein
MITYKAFVNGVQLTASAATYYTTAASTKALIKKATFCNDNTISVTVTINLVPSGGTAGYANRITKAKVLTAGQTWSCPDVDNHVLEAGGFISMLASTADKVSVRVSGYEVT